MGEEIESKKYPECEKMKEVKPYSQKIGLFIEWLLSSGVMLSVPHHHTEDCLFRDQELEKMRKKNKFDAWEVCLGDFHEGELIPWSYNIEKLLAEFFEIDLNKRDEELNQMLEELRQSQSK